MKPKWATEIIHTCLNVTAGEKFLIFGDEPLTEPLKILAEEAQSIGLDQVWTYILPDATRPLSALPGDLVRLANEAGVILAMLAEFDPEQEYPAFMQLMPLMQNGRTRFAMASYITADILEHELSADYTRIAAETLAIAEQLQNTAQVRIVTEGGTDLRLSVVGRSWLTDTGLFRGPGFGNLPAGEVFIAPLEQSANGVLVIDGTIYRSAVDRPIRVTFENGQAVCIEGGESARLLESLLALNDGQPGSEWGRFIGEFGIGTNAGAKLRGNIASDEKALGTIHVALGQNAIFGGQNMAAMHLDGVVTRPTVWVDERMVIQDGRLLIGEKVSSSRSIED